MVNTYVQYTEKLFHRKSINIWRVTWGEFSAAICIGQVLVYSPELSLKTLSCTAFAGSPLCTLRIPNTVLLCLYDGHSTGYVQGINARIRGKMVTLDTSCSRLEGALRRAATALATSLRQCKGSRGRAKIQEGFKYVLVGVGETIDVQVVQEQLEVRSCVQNACPVH